jgi:hypothetical protein
VSLPRAHARDGSMACTHARLACGHCSARRSAECGRAEVGPVPCLTRPRRATHRPIGSALARPRGRATAQPAGASRRRGRGGTLTSARCAAAIACAVGCTPPREMCAARLYCSAARPSCPWASSAQHRSPAEVHACSPPAPSPAPTHDFPFPHDTHASDRFAAAQPHAMRSGAAKPSAKVVALSLRALPRVMHAAASPAG